MKREKSDVVYMQGPKDPGSRLTRILPSANDKWNEAWLQSLLFDHPELLPVSEFDPQFGVVIPLAREVGVPNGSIDNLYITTTAQLLVVETKLWKNPEAHRVVVAQIMQYATDLYGWDYNKLDIAVSMARKEKPGAIERLVSAHASQKGIDFHQFQEELQRSLRAGRFLLLIVGDQISPNVAFLSRVVQSQPGMEFSLGLVELRIHALNNNRDWPLIIVPDVVGRTVEETRAIVRIEHNSPCPTITVPDQGKEKVARGKVTLETLAAQLPPEFKLAFEEFASRWQTNGHLFSFGRVGVAFHVRQNKTTFGVCELYPHLVSGLTRKRIGSVITEALFTEYITKIKQAPTIFQRLNAGKPYISLKSLPPEEFSILMQATFNIADAIAQANADN